MFSMASGNWYFRGMTIAGAGATPPTTLFGNLGTQQSPMVTVEDSDLSGRAFTNIASATSVGAGSGFLTLRNCKLPSSVSVTTGSFASPNGFVVKMHDCDSADTHIRFSENRWEGTVTQQTSTLIRTGGAVQADGTAFSMLMAGNANTVNIFHPLASPEFSVYNTSVGSSMTATVEILRDNATALKDNEIWLEIDYLGTSGTPVGSRGSDRMTNVLSTAADQASSSATWNTGAMSAPNTQKLVVTFTPREAGYIIARVMLAANTSVYVDPYITLA
jgi:hypothetical protein